MSMNFIKRPPACLVGSSLAPDQVMLGSNPNSTMTVSPKNGGPGMFSPPV